VAKERAKEKLTQPICDFTLFLLVILNYFKSDKYFFAGETNNGLLPERNKSLILLSMLPSIRNPQF